MAIQIQMRRGTAGQWQGVNPILAEGELGYETDTQLYKIGNGSTAWNDLYYGGLNPELGVITYEGQLSAPSAPGAGDLRMYAQSLGGRMLLRFMNPAGNVNTVQPAIFGNGFQIYTPGATTAMNVTGGPALTIVGTMSHPALVSTNMRTSTSRANVVSAATANAAAEARVAQARIWRGDQPGYGGFFHRTRFSIASTTANQRAFIGFTSTTTAISTTQEPNALTDMFGIGCGLGQTTLRMYQNNASGTAIEVDLGPDFPSNDPTLIFDLTMYAAPNSTQITWQATNLNNGSSAVGTFTDNELPLSTVFMAYHAYMNNGGTAAAVSLDLIKIYTETIT